METSPLPVKGFKILAYARSSGPLSREGSLSCNTCCDTRSRFFRSHPKDHRIQSSFTTHKGCGGPILTRVLTGAEGGNDEFKKKIFIWIADAPSENQLYDLQKLNTRIFKYTFCFVWLFIAAWVIFPDSWRGYKLMGLAVRVLKNTTCHIRCDIGPRFVRFHDSHFGMPSFFSKGKITVLGLTRSVPIYGITKLELYHWATATGCFTYCGFTQSADFGQKIP